MTAENRTSGQSADIQMTDVDHGANGVTVVARDPIGRNPVFHFLHTSTPREEVVVPQSPSLLQTLSTLRQESKKSGLNDGLNTLHPKP